MLIRVIICFLITCIYSQNLSAKTYECDAVDEISMLGISPRAAVSVSADSDENECKFSVNGAKVGSPPQAQVSEAFNRLLFQGRQLFDGPFDATSLAAMMLAAGPDDNTDEVSSILDGAEFQITGCINELRNRVFGSIADPFEQDFELPSNSGVCVVLSSGGFEFGPISIRYDEGESIPTMLLFLQRGSVTNLLAVPGLIQ